MTGVGEILFLIAIFAMIAPPVERTLTNRRATQSAIFEETLRTAFPMMPPSPPLDALAHEAELAIERDDLMRGIAESAETYDRADDGERPET